MLGIHENIEKSSALKLHKILKEKERNIAKKPKTYKIYEYYIKLSLKNNELMSKGATLPL